MKARLLIPLLAALALIACAGDDEASEPDQTDSPSVTPASTRPPADTPAPATPPGMNSTDYWFRGVVSEMNTGCYVDALCSVTVEVTESLAGASLEQKEVVVIESYGFSPRRCEGQWTETPPGTEVEVLAHAAEDDSLAVCEAGHYFVKELRAEY
jgi:hypothetical protein